MALRHPPDFLSKGLKSNCRDLKNRLIQQDRLAQLGFLSAGIAHELKNPLNLSLNFMRLSSQLAQELQESINKKKPDLKLCQDLISNLKKSHDHCQRASQIIVHMLSTARGEKEKKESININALLETYLMLAYHAHRAHTPTFNVTFQKNYASDLPPLLGYAADLGRVVINLIDNAIYSMIDKSKADASYKPCLSITTQQTDTAIDLSIQDNGLGIAPEVRERLFEAFFSTKPTSKGTGLGLSLVQEIIEKNHKGQIHVQSKEGEGTKFTLSLPLSNAEEKDI